MGIIVLSLVVAFARASSGGIDIVQLTLVGLRIAVFFAAAVFAGRWLTPFFRWAVSLGVNQAVLAAALVVAFVYSWAAEYFGAVAAITGAYVAASWWGRTEFKKQVDAAFIR
jgi:Kef-type K+ transport system membrane component KefB